MNEKIRIRRTAAPVKTPRVSVQSSNGFISSNQHVAYVSQQKNILPILPSSTETSHFIALKHSLHIFIDTLTHFLSRNGTIISLRAQFSQQTSEMEKLFNMFYQIAIKGSVQQNKANPSLRTSAINFLKFWQVFILSIIELKKTITPQISQSINSHYNSITGSLDSVMNYGVSRSNIYDQPYRNGRVLQNQLNCLKQTSEIFLSKTFKANQFKNHSAEIKAFSRLLNDTFTREFTQCGIASNEVVRLRSKCYTACCDIIHGLKNAYLFETDMMKLFRSIFNFQESLRDILEKFNLPTNYLVQFDFESEKNNHINEDEEEEEAEEEKIITFDEDLELLEFIKDSHDKAPDFMNDRNYVDKFFEVLNSIALNTISELTTKKQMNDQENEIIIHNIKNITQENENLINEKENLTNENEKLIREKTQLENEFQQLHIEYNKITEKMSQISFDTNNAEQMLINRIDRLKQALFTISNNGLKNEELTNEDDDFVINNAIKANNDLKDKYQNSKEMEDKIREIIGSENIISYIKALISEREETSRNENESLLYYQETENNLKNIMSSFSNLDSLVDVANEISDSFNKIKLIVNCNSLSEGVDSIFMMFSNIKSSLLKISNGSNSDNISKIISDLEANFNSVKNILTSIVNHDGTIHEIAKELSTQHLCYISNFKAILLTINPLIGHTISDNIENIDQLTLNSVKKMKEIVDNIVKNMSSLAGTSMIHPPTSPIELILQQIKSIERKLNQDRQVILEYQSVCSDVESTLSSYCEISNRSSNVSIPKSIRMLLKKLPPKQNVNNSTNNQSIKNIDIKLSKILNTECSNDSGRLAHIIELIDSLDNKLKKSNEFKAMIEAKLGLKNVAYEKILAQIGNQNNNINFEKLFENVFDLVPVTSRSDPLHYIPEFCNAFVSLNNSILALKPFASILNTIFGQFDCKYSSFNPTSPSFQFIRSQVFSLHSALNGLTPSKVNSLVFLVLSRFVALMSSFMAAISSSSYDGNNPEMKEAFFKLQNELLESKKSS
ncbi:hypothetical protein TRFO_17431 [Tritrichomonas foetus]|uniref:Uncharacterized protein n=1 Tax=Tritrichomonas foetus TaxID=1144522 RepID=A0A1J4KNK0_9EUKA|nr:hypothetical protein TRFO_17431 [Tritrichomonas foetus]|eukprot:OHT12706.1 hypothetical protein TRFO_17431 [Tritrichomonas foetus]